MSNNFEHTYIKEVCNTFTELRSKVPLVQCITNYVTINDCANVLLAYGASPAMCEAYDEVFDFTKISSALYLNVGTLTKEQEEAAVLSSISAKMNNVPVVLDPVACAAIPRKLSVINRILELGRVDVIKGNIGEIKFLAGKSSEVRGVDSLDNGDDALDACIALAQKYNCVVAATGKKDYITDGIRSAIIENGTEMLTKVTGAGCMVGALCGGTAAVSEDKFISTVTAILSMNLAGEEAHEIAKAPGSFRVKLIDCIYTLTEEKLMEEGRITWK
ncbi:hydroxyethylthiazole kinase [Clostridium sp. A1-XYC3]|uniref:Hydroxyethylthiazole kinase n=1 Tax=Clostridium tanneri TaxID=3037988 RepID=A0ABU4JVA0_9CLOT|nr:hydroxyethylthiazole kinase [Clostridium sp. A1-XYC3]MDW8801891.1 hydroxyethylthiazole kinase [Clostridium sp. A1-XYC3]